MSTKHYLGSIGFFDLATAARLFEATLRHTPPRVRGWVQVRGDDLGHVDAEHVCIVPGVPYEFDTARCTRRKEHELAPGVVRCSESKVPYRGEFTAVEISE